MEGPGTERWFRCTQLRYRTGISADVARRTKDGKATEAREGGSCLIKTKPDDCRRYMLGRHAINKSESLLDDTHMSLGAAYGLGTHRMDLRPKQMRGLRPLLEACRSLHQRLSNALRRCKRQDSQLAHRSKARQRHKVETTA